MVCLAKMSKIHAIFHTRVREAFATQVYMYMYEPNAMD